MLLFIWLETVPEMDKSRDHINPTSSHAVDIADHKMLPGSIFRDSVQAAYTMDGLALVYMLNMVEVRLHVSPLKWSVGQ